MNLQVNERAVVEVINFDEKTSWVRWYTPDFSDCGNINLPEGNWELENQDGGNLTLKQIN